MLQNNIIQYLLKASPQTHVGSDKFRSAACTALGRTTDTASDSM